MAGGRPEYSVPFSERHGANAEVASEAISAVTQLASHLSNRNRADVRKAAQCVIYNLCMAYQAGLEYPDFDRVGVYYSMNTSHKVRGGRRYRAGCVKKRPVQDILLGLTESGMVNKDSGVFGYIKNVPKGIPAYFCPRSGFAEFVSQNSRSTIKDILGSQIELLYPDVDIETVILRDENKWLKEYDDNPVTLITRKYLKRQYEVNSNAVWRVMGDQQIVQPDQLWCCRIFNNGSFHQGGRFYLPLQNLPSIHRPTITINDESTVECDFVSYQPRLLYHKDRLLAPDDCYEVPGIPRVVVKHACMLAINCRTRRDAAINLVAQKFDGVGTYQDAGAVLDAVVNHHELIKKYLLSGYGMSLQYYDSLIAEIIISQAAHHSIPILPIHDSFVVREQDKDWLLEAMTTAYTIVTGADCSEVVIKTE